MPPKELLAQLEANRAPRANTAALEQQIDWNQLSTGGPNLGQLPIKLLEKDAKAPTRAHAADAGLDLYAYGDHIVDPFQNRVKVRTGIAMAIPAGHVGLLFPRSSLYQNYGGLKLTNCVGVIDSDYRGEIIASMHAGYHAAEIADGDKIVQLVIVPIITPEIVIVDELPTTERGEGGFGSTGKA